jgi:cytidylate kinase
MAVITVRGQMGSGAPEIGKRVAEKLRYDYVDREIVAEIAARLGYPKRRIEAKEMPAGTLAGRISEALNRSYPMDTVGGGMGTIIPMYLPTWDAPLDDPNYLSRLEAVIKELAASQAIVIRGRGSQFILKDFPHSLHVLVIAPLPLRVSRVMSGQKIDEKTARQKITRFDTSRREFIKRYFKVELEDPVHYDLVINTEHLTFEDAAFIITETLSLRGPAGGN